MSLTGTDKSEEIFRSRLVSGHDHLTENAIVVKGLKKSYKNIKVLDGIDFTIKRGTVLALLGPNGAGKLLRLTYLVHYFCLMMVRR